jgi:peroxiredoxin
MLLMRILTVLAVGLGLVSLPAAGATIPRQAQELTFKLVGGQQAKLSQWRGKVIVLEFLLTTCSHCQRTSQLMNQLQAEYGARGVQGLGIAVNDLNGSLTAAYARENGLKYPVGWLKHEAAVDFLQHPVMVGMMMPQLVFIDRTGVIRAQYPGTDPFFQNEEVGMRKMIESLLKEPAGGRKPPSLKSSTKAGK